MPDPGTPRELSSLLAENRQLRARFEAAEQQLEELQEELQDAKAVFRQQIDEMTRQKPTNAAAP